MNQYDVAKTWRTNLTASPEPPDKFVDSTALPGEWQWCGFSLDSPLGIPAGPLLDGRWILHYANLGFDWLVYKTVRSGKWDCYDLPNLVPVDTGPLSKPGFTVPIASKMGRTWAVSFGMPSQEPNIWQRDVEWTRSQLPSRKCLVVSVVGTQDPSLTDPDAALDQLADDFALCARWAVESGADGVEANFSCPNVSTHDGQLYQKPQDAEKVAIRIRDTIGSVPLVLKIGHVGDREHAKALLVHLAPHCNGLAMTNSIAARVRGQSGEHLFDSQPRGICGAAIRDASIAQVEMFRKICDDQLDLIGVGGIFNKNDVESYLQAGADSVGIATAAMLNPEVGREIRQQWLMDGGRSR